MKRQKIDSKIIPKLEKLFLERNKGSIQARLSQLCKEKGVPRGAAAEIMARQKNSTVWSWLSEDDQKCFRESRIEVKGNSGKIEDAPKQSVIDPLSISLSQFNLFPELAKECKIKKPYSKEINHAILNLEDFMRKKMKLDETFHSKGLVEEARRKNIFKRKLESESQGLYFMYMSAFLWLRNGGFHKKQNAEKDECFKLIMFIDYLIKLFDKLANENDTTNTN